MTREGRFAALKRIIDPTKIARRPPKRARVVSKPWTVPTPGRVSPPHPSPFPRPPEQTPRLSINCPLTSGNTATSASHTQICPCANLWILSSIWGRGEGGRRAGREQTAGDSKEGLGPSPLLAMAILTGAGANATIEGIRGTPASVAPLPGILRDLGDKDAATAAARSGSTFTIDGQGEKLDLAMHDRQDKGKAPALLVAAARAS